MIKKYLIIYFFLNISLIIMPSEFQKHIDELNQNIKKRKEEREILQKQREEEKRKTDLQKIKSNFSEILKMLYSLEKKLEQNLNNLPNITTKQKDEIKKIEQTIKQIKKQKENQKKVMKQRLKELASDY